MIRFPVVLPIIVVYLLVVPGSSLAGPTLDRILNNMILDVTSGGLNQKEFKVVTPDRPIGQTFTTGPKTVEVSRIAIAAPYWHESWTEGESLVMTLWDSPAKSKQIASAEMPYKWRAWEGTVIMYTLNAVVQPSTQYYFELTVKGGDGEIVGIYLGGDYEQGQAFEAGKPADRNIWFEVHSRPIFDRDAVYADRFKDWNLDYPGLEKVKAAVAAKDWDKAVDELVAYYEARADLVNPEDKPKKNPDFDPTDADLALDMKYRESKEVVVDLGPNWNHYRIWPTRGGVGLTRTGLFKFFRAGYINTGDEKYAKGFNEFMTHFLNDMPSPLRAGVIKPTDKDVNPAPGPGLAGASMWAGLSIGARMNQMWWAYSGFHSSPNFTRDIRAGMIFNMVDMATVLSMQKGGGNWESQMTTALYEFAERHPELAKSKQWFEKGLNEMIANLWSTSRADGSVQEPTFGYTTLIINRYRALLDTCRKLKISLDPKYIRRVEKTIEYLMYNTEPDGLLPSRGDTFNFVNGLGLLSWGADFFGREDFRYVATSGKTGRIPSGTSEFFPIGGWMVMRSDWSRNALYLNLHNGKDMGHGHYDQLSIVVDAYGAKLIVDPGCYIYGTPEHEKLRKTTSHATVTVDDADTHVYETGSNYWACMTSMDYYEGTNIGYRGVPGVLHTRKVVFFKPWSTVSNSVKNHAGEQIPYATRNDGHEGYWLVQDTVTGLGTHEVACRFPFYPGPVLLDESTGVCRTEYQDANILILPCLPEGFGWSLYEYGFPTSGNKLAPAFGVKYSKKTELPVAFAAALI
ncbi:MAG: heparinase II/III family protein, partial [Armatimonadetes bacterium]|nr:heparinase II/III family protein [Armatimonadota bacterium]